MPPSLATKRSRSKKQLPSDGPVERRGDIANDYWDMVPERQPYLDRARDCSRITIPSLIPPQSYPAKNYRFPTPYQSVGARGVNHLTSKLLLALFPSNTPFFRYLVDDEEVEKELSADEQTKGAVDLALSTIERGILNDFERSALRVPIAEALKHLLVGGNILLYIDPKTGKGRSIPLSRFCVRRDPQGNTLSIVVMEEIDHDSLPENLRQAEEKLDEEEGQKEAHEREDEEHEGHSDGREEVVTVYTRISRTAKNWKFEQEIDGAIVVTGQYKLDASPWLPLRMIAVDGEDYGRGLIEEYYGDLSSLEKLSKSIVQFAAAAAKIVFLVHPNASTKPAKLSKAQSGDFVPGNKVDIDVLQLEKYNDFQVAKATADGITERLSYAFLMYSAVQRNGERVTAQEIRLMAQELDSGFGGIYATLSQELQLPVVKILQANRMRNGKLPRIPHFDKIVRPTLVTGVEALGRGQDLQNLLSALSIIGQYPAFVQRLEPEEFMNRVFSASSVDPKGLIIDKDTWAQMQQRNSAAEAAGPAGAEAVKAFARHAGTVAAQAQQPTSVEAATPSAVHAPQQVAL